MIPVTLSLTNQVSGFLPVFSPNVTLVRVVFSKPLLLILWGHFLSVREGLALTPGGSVGGRVVPAPRPSAVAGMLAHGRCCAARQELVRGQKDWFALSAICWHLPDLGPYS